MPSTVLQRIPFIRITVLFLIGLLIAQYIPIHIKISAIAFVLLLCSLIFLWYSNSFTGTRMQNLLVALCIVFAGIFYKIQGTKELSTNLERKDYFLAEICQSPEKKSNSWQTIVLLQNYSLKKPVKAIAWFSKVGFDSTLLVGDQLILIASPQRIKNAGNPFEFDFQGMMHQKEINYTLYLKPGFWMKTGNRDNRLIYWPELIRWKLIHILECSNIHDQERAVVAALTLGYRTELDPETIDYFASTGAMHVLSVSGLHVALIYMILGYLLVFIKRGKTGQIVFSAVMLAFLWLYALITGFSPPVQRATVMFTFIIIGNNIRRPVNVYNSLTASALFLILLNPSVISDVGFQLSYLAIFGIILIQSALSSIFEISNKFLKWSWDLFTVSVAAQITTFPLGLYYFNQFPNLFWLSNFVVIPITTLIIWLSLAFFIFTPLQGIALLIGAIIQNLTSFMLLSLKWMDNLPMAVSKGIVLTSGQMLLLYGSIATLLVFAFYRKKEWLIGSLLIFIGFQIVDLQERKKVFGQHVVIVYNTKKMMIHLINGRNNYLISNDVKNLTRSEKMIVTKVCYHLRLTEPKFLNFSELKQSTSDLFMDKNHIQFLNCKLNLIGMANTGPEKIEFILLAQQNNPKQKTSIICLGNQFIENEPDVTIHKVNKEGAFFARLESGETDF